MIQNPTQVNIRGVAYKMLRVLIVWEIIMYEIVQNHEIMLL